MGGKLDSCHEARKAVGSWHDPHGYDEYTRQALADQGIDIPGDVERNRRIDKCEEGRIVETLRRRAEAAQTLEDRVEAEALSLIFQLALPTLFYVQKISHGKPLLIA